MPSQKSLQLSLLTAFTCIACAHPANATTYTVNTTQDPGPPGTLSLRQAINATNIGDTINFNPSLNGQSCKVSSTLTIFKQNLTITSAGLSNGMTVDAAGTCGPVMSTGQNLTLVGLTITGGKDVAAQGSAGGIANGQLLTLTNCKVTGNQSTNGVGGIYSTFELIMSGTTVSNNSGANGGVQSFNAGPGNQSFLTMTNCTVSGNSCPNGEAGVSVIGSGIANIQTSTFSSNITNPIFNAGVAVGGDATVTSCKFTGNTGTAVSHSSDGRGQMTLTGCDISGNNCGSSNAVNELSIGSRGRIITISNCKIMTNTGGGLSQNSYTNNVSSQIMNMSGCQITGNTLGAITNTFAALNLTNCKVNNNGSYPSLGTVVNNMATMSITTSTISGNKDTGLGAIYTYAKTQPNQSNLSVTYSTISGNSSKSGRGGGIVSINQGAGSNVTINTSTVSGNVANATTGKGGGIYFDGGTTPCTLTLTGSTITKNSAQSGGGVYLEPVPTATVSVDSSIIAGNHNSDKETPDLSGTVVSKGYNLVGVVDGSAGWVATDQTGDESLPLDAKLGPLANNG